MMKVPPGIVYRQPLKTLPPNLLQGMGRVIVAHSRLELFLTELLYDLLRIDHPLGRQIVQGHNTVDIFKTINRLLDLWNITPTNRTGLQREIEIASAKRNTIAHGVWVRLKGKDIGIRLVREKRDTPVGSLDRRIMPQFAKRKLREFLDDTEYIHKVSARVRALKKEIGVALEAWPPIVPS